LFSKIRIYFGYRNTVECQIPRRIPGKLPIVGHENDIVVVQVSPFVIPPAASLRRRGRAGGISFEPGAHIVVVGLLRPEQTCKRLALHVSGLGRETLRRPPTIKLFRFSDAFREDLVKRLAERFRARPFWEKT